MDCAGCRFNLFMVNYREKWNEYRRENIMIEIIEATVDEAARCAPLFNAYRMFYGKSADLAGAERYLRERLSRKESVVFLACEEGEPVGFMQLYPTFSSLSMQSQWILNDLYVHGERRGRGLGRLLIGEAFQLAKRTEAKGVALSTASDNVTAQKLYESLGFVRDQAFWTYEWQHD
jgi:ribosomal protein S18 acetylase RimI-like enzyme